MLERPAQLERIHTGLPRRDNKYCSAGQYSNSTAASMINGLTNLSQPGLLVDSSSSYVESRHSLNMLVDCARKVLMNGQVAIIVIVPHIIHWVTTQSQQQLSNTANDVTSIIEALEGKLGGPNSELVAEHIVRASTRAQLGIQNRNTIELMASENSYKADLDCYFDDPDMHAIIALLTPISNSAKGSYEEAQLSSIRYHIGVMETQKQQNQTDKQPNGQSSNHLDASEKQRSNAQQLNLSIDTTFADLYYHETLGQQNQSLNDLTPTTRNREVEYFYSLLPNSATRLYSHHELELARSESIREQELQAHDPDHLDPHERMRLVQQLSLSPVLPRKPRNVSEVQEELRQAQILAIRPNIVSAHRSNDIKCLECGTDTSPEWRKGPHGPKTLCNRCGLRYAKKLRAQR